MEDGLLVLYLLQFNNYYNRQYKYYDSLSVYSQYMCTGGFLDQNPITDVNFIPNDGVNTKQVINWDGEAPDYVLVCDNYNNILSRWFVIESVRTLTGQYELTLRRDLISDFYPAIIEAPMFIEKGYLSRRDPGIFNAENMTFNQIKKREDLLKDGTGCAWIVGYCTEKSAIPDNKITFGGVPIPDEVLDDIDDWAYADYIDTDHKIVNMESVTNGFAVKYLYSGGGLRLYKVLFTKNTNEITSREATGNDNDIILKMGLKFEYLDQENYLNTIRGSEELTRLTRNQLGYSSLSVGNITRLNNRILKVGSGEGTIYYRVKVNRKTETLIKVLPAGSNAYNAQLEIARNIYITDPDSANNGEQFFYGLDDPKQSIFAEYEEDTVSITLIAITSKSGFEMTDFPEDRPTLIDAPYSMFCIPYGDYTYRIGNQVVQVSKENSISLAVGIATALGGTGQTNIYDLQLLPYCPISLLREIGPSIDLQDASVADSLAEFVYHLESRTVLFFCKESTGSFNITLNFYTNLSAIDFKVKAQTEFWRLCSPNYNGVFEFNPYKNYGTNYINVDYTYKPYQPYIHLNPDFRGLYGGDYNDARGLICSGDFGLPIVDDAWIDYQIGNKNYNEIFKRNMDSMDLQHNVQASQDVFNAIVGTVGGGITGGLAGSYGGPWGAVAGAVVGTAAAGAGGYLDYQMNQLLREDARDLSKDLFNYNLGNVQALPDALSKVSAYNANNKIFPFIERYDCTPEEKEALKNKIIYNGMSVGRIGKLVDFIVNVPVGEYGYFKGQLIRLEGIGDDYHLTNKIAEELNKGVYIHG
jgi:hypothetical protein